MARAHRALHHGRHLAEVKHPGVLGGIYLLDSRDESDVDTRLTELGAVGLLCAGIGRQVGGIVELGGIHEDTDHHRPVFAARAVDQ